MGMVSIAGPGGGRVEFAGVGDDPATGRLSTPPQLTNSASKSQLTSLIAMELTIRPYRLPLYAMPTV
jgi:hypothetical protein